MKASRRIELMPLSKLEGAKKNPKQHDAKAIDESFSRFGYVEPIVRDERTGRLVAGHGRTDQLGAAFKKAPGKPPAGVEVVRKDGEITEWLVPVLRGWRSKNDAQAAAYLVASNRITEAGGWDDRALTELLKELNETDTLVGTGFDEQQLAALAFVTRHANEVGDINEAAEWVGMPEFDAGPIASKMIINFESDADREKLTKLLKIENFGQKTDALWSCWWPPRAKDDPSSVKFKAKAKEKKR